MLMKKLIYLTLILTFLLFSDDGNDVVNIANISFQDMNWSENYETTYEDVLYSRQRIADLTANKRAVILYFFDLHIC